ncbi:hypothetical protein [Streptomyces sp. NPDC093089]|uniref:hypothetical protein n=1 Tax=Streptomyces sp. NPDC093089 TaxID=3366024 RepID=UPI00380E5BB9
MPALGHFPGGLAGALTVEVGEQYRFVRPGGADVGGESTYMFGGHQQGVQACLHWQLERQAGRECLLRRAEPAVIIRKPVDQAVGRRRQPLRTGQSRDREPLRHRDEVAGEQHPAGHVNVGRKTLNHARTVPDLRRQGPIGVDVVGRAGKDPAALGSRVLLISERSGAVVACPDHGFAAADLWPAEGENAAVLARAGIETTAVDFSAVRVVRARRFRADEPRLTFVHAEACACLDESTS